MKRAAAALTFFALALLMLWPVAASRAERPRGVPARAWRPATATELADVLPARAPVVQERIETEASSHSGITDGQGHFLAATVLITAGYAAHGKFSQYLVVGAPVQFGSQSGGVDLKPGNYLIGWTRDEAGLHVTFYEAASGNALGSVEALPSNPPVRVVPVHVWPPSQRSALQIGRFLIPYELR